MTPVDATFRGFFMPRIKLHNMEHPAYYAILPANVRYDKDLKPMEKIMFAEITALCNKDGFCSASNRYFADLYGVDESTVSRWIGRLAAREYVAVLITRNERKAIIGRQIFATPIDKKVNTLLTKKSIPSPQKSQYPIDKKVKVNTTSINTTSINTLSKSENPKIDWMTVAQAMADHAKGDGAKQWEFMCQATGYDADPLPIFSAWASKASDNERQTWRDHFHRVQSWMRTAAIQNLKIQNHATPNGTANGRVRNTPKARTFFSVDEFRT